ncbi:hypothetical protein CTI14_70490, partial [Methylobacterium radiotolerans]
TVLYAQGNRQRWDVDPASPADLLSDSSEEGTPLGVWQSGSSTVLYAQGNRQRWDVDPASPADLLSDSSEEGTPL